MKVLWIGVGGFAGAISRYAIDTWVTTRARGAMPWGTFTVNITGCFLLGLAIALLTERFSADPLVRAALTVGFLGAYTTFSTFAYESLRLGEEGSLAIAAFNIVGSVTAGLIAVIAGTALGRAI